MNDFYKIVTSLVVISLGFTNSALAADWSIAQTSILSVGAPELTQTNVASSTQALNGVVLDESNDDLVNGSQSIDVGGTSLSLTQSGASTNDSVQALNMASAKSISGLTQEVTGFDSVQLTLESTTGAGNVQALNYSRAEGDTANLTQSLSGTSMIAVNDSSGNVQAANYAESDTYSGDLLQVTTLSTLNVTNLGGTDMRVNSVQGDTSGTTSVTQTSSIGTITVSGPSTVIINHVGP
jgi:hypothetical protein